MLYSNKVSFLPVTRHQKTGYPSFQLGTLQFYILMHCPAPASCYPPCRSPWLLWKNGVVFLSQVAFVVFFPVRSFGQRACKSSATKDLPQNETNSGFSAVPFECLIRGSFTEDFFSEKCEPERRRLAAFEMVSFLGHVNFFWVVEFS